MPPIPVPPPAQFAASLPEQQDQMPPEKDRLSRTVIFEDLTLAQALRYLIWRPGQTLRLFWQVLVREPEMEQEPVGSELAPPDVSPETPSFVPDLPAGEESHPAGEDRGTARAETPILVPERQTPQPWLNAADRVILAGLVLLLLAVLLALRGGQVLHDSATTLRKKEARDIGSTVWWFVLAGMVYGGLELFWSRGWWARRLPRLNAMLYRRFRSYELPHLWTTGLLMPVLFLAALVVMIKAGVVLTVLLVALAGVLWLLVLLGNTPPAVPDTAHVPAGYTPLETEAGAEDEAVFVVRSAVRPAMPQAVPAAQPRGFWAWIEAHIFQVALIPFALLCSALTYSLNVSRDPLGRVNDVILTTGGSLAWVISILLWVTILGTDVRRLPGQLRKIAFTEVRWGPLLRRVRIDWPLVALAGVMVIGAVFRVANLSVSPPEMTSDHIEKLLDSLRVWNGYHPVFFANNGGREAFQMYFVAFIAGTLHVGFNFDALKLATAAEGIVTLPALWWMARQVIGTETEESRRLGSWIGVALAGLVAVSSWHVMLSRLGLRIVLTPLTTALVIGFLARAMRHNRMRDYILLGIVLGVGTYFYQANRMLPILVGFGFAVAVLAKLRRPRDVAVLLGRGIGLAVLALVPLLTILYIGQVLKASTYRNPHDWGAHLSGAVPLLAMGWFALLALILRARRSEHVLQYGGGLLAVVVMTFALYIPMYHYSVIYPDQFWNRTRGRLFGEEAFWRVDPKTGQTVAYEPTLKEQIDRFWPKRDIFLNNYKKSLLMFHWDGDGAWISNAHSYPALDAFAGGLMILGCMVWVVWAIKRRDPVWWLLPSAVIVMLLPSALTLVYLIENPNFTRGSGTVPPAYMLAALPLGLLLWQFSRLSWRVGRVRIGAVTSAGLLIVTLLYSMGPDWNTIFTTYPQNYVYSWKPYTLIAQPMHDFATGEGSYGNAFMIAYPNWLDHRILGTMAGDIHWPNGVVTRDELLSDIRRNQGTRYQYDPNKPLFIMYEAQDMDTEAYLKQLFPGGEQILYTYHFETQPGIFSVGTFYIYKVWAGNIPLG